MEQTEQQFVAALLRSFAADACGMPESRYRAMQARAKELPDESSRPSESDRPE